MSNHHTPPPRPQDHFHTTVSWSQAPADIDEPPKLVVSSSRLREGQAPEFGPMFSATILDMPLAVPDMHFLNYVTACLGTITAVVKVQERAIYWPTRMRVIPGILIPPTLAGRSFNE